MAEPAPLWSWQDLLAAAHGQGHGAPHGPITGFSIDTRALVPGEVFVALKDQRDGHEFVAAAFAAGASAALLRADFDAPAGCGPLIRVDDPLQALVRIARAARARLSAEARVIGVTGSAGKTGTKEMLRACLATAGTVHAPEKSFNNHWGVPLTLARMPADTDFAVIEMGMNHPGEIRPLSRLAQPHVALITNVLPVHVGNFADGELGIARAKAEIFEGLMPGATAILPQDSPHLETLAAAARTWGAEVVTFGTTGGQVCLDGLDMDAVTSHVRVRLPSRATPLDVTLGTLGVHIAHNSLGVIAALEALGLPLETATAPLASVGPPPGRGARTQLVWSGGTVLLIDESYNANPASMRAAIAVLGAVPRTQYPRRVAVLGDMLELGGDAVAYHRQLARALEAADVDLLLACGTHMRALFESVPAGLRGVWTPDSATLVPHVLDVLRAGDVVMVKGSLGSRMALIVEALKARACPA